MREPDPQPPRMRYGSRRNLATLAIGIALLIGGSVYYQALDWDIPISLIMAGFAYLTAAWSMQVMVYRVWRQWPLMLLATWWTVDGCYAVHSSAIVRKRAHFARNLTLIACVIAVVGRDIWVGEYS